MRLHFMGVSLALILAVLACQEGPTAVTDSGRELTGAKCADPPCGGGGGDSKPGRSAADTWVELSGGYTLAALPVGISVKTKGKMPLVTFLETQDGEIDITMPLVDPGTVALCKASANTAGFDAGNPSHIIDFWNGTGGPFPYPRTGVLRNFFAKVDLTANGSDHEEHRSHGVYFEGNGIRWNYRVGTSLDDVATGNPLWPGVLSTGTWNENQESPVVTISGGVMSLSRTNQNTGERIRVSCLNEPGLGGFDVDFVVDRCDDDDPSCAP